MRVFVIGGVTLSPKHRKYRAQLSMTTKLMEEIGRKLILHRHELLVCSPHKGSADRDVVRGAASLLKKIKEARIEFHTPLLKETQKELHLLTRFLPTKKIKTFHYPVSADEHGTPNFTYTWLLSQLSAMARSQVVLTCGGRLDGAASLLLPIAESQRKNVLPLTFLGGAAAQSFERQRSDHPSAGQGTALLSSSWAQGTRNDPTQTAETSEGQNQGISLKRQTLAGSSTLIHYGRSIKRSQSFSAKLRARHIHDT